MGNLIFQNKLVDLGKGLGGTILGRLGLKYNLPPP